MSVQYSSQKNFNHSNLQKIGILLVNLGTPDAPNTKSLKKYLKQFLSDPRVIELPRFFWFFILNFIVLPFRSPKSAQKYRTIWIKAGSPLLVQLQRRSMVRKNNFLIFGYFLIHFFGSKNTCSNCLNIDCLVVILIDKSQFRYPTPLF